MLAVVFLGKKSDFFFTHVPSSVAKKKINFDEKGFGKFFKKKKLHFNKGLHLAKIDFHVSNVIMKM